MRIAVTGSNGFLGRAVVSKLLKGDLGSVTLLRLNDLRPSPVAGAESVIGSFDDIRIRKQLLAGGVDVLFHLASLPGGASEQDFERGRVVNLTASMSLIDEAAQAGRRPIIVYTSTVAVLGMIGREKIDDKTALRPLTTYGSQKAMVETYLTDLSRRGVIDARIVRPAGIVSRPAQSYAGFATAWMSDLFRGLALGRDVAVPIASDHNIWLQSLSVVADNIVHAAGINTNQLDQTRAWTLPATVARIDKLAEIILDRTGRRGEVSFGQGGMDQPPLDASDALAMGFKTDGAVKQLVDNVLAQLRQEERDT